jgi:hypothetical protein
MRFFLILSSIMLLFIGVFGSTFINTPVEITPSASKIDERKLSYVKGQNHLSIKQIDSVTAFSNVNLAHILDNK